MRVSGKDHQQRSKSGNESTGFPALDARAVRLPGGGMMIVAPSRRTPGDSNGKTR